MRLGGIILATELVVSVAAASSQLWQMPSIYRDARVGCDVTMTDEAQIKVFVSLPPGVHEAFTVMAWLRAKPELPGNHQLTTYAFWCPDAIQRSNPDLLANAGGYASGGINLTELGGSVAVPGFPFSGYAGITAAVSNKWPRGVYTIVGSSTNAITVSLGGEDVVVGPGAFNRNAIPGPSSDVVISGTGTATVGISRTPCHRFFHEFGAEINAVTGSFTYDSLVTNELTMCTWRFDCSGGKQVYKSNLGRMGSFNDVSQTKTNECVGGYSSQGHYEVGLQGITIPPYTYDIFDARLFTRWLTDAELDRIHLNSVQEIQRRGIPRWR